MNQNKAFQRSPLIVVILIVVGLVLPVGLFCFTAEMQLKGWLLLFKVLTTLNFDLLSAKDSNVSIALLLLNMGCFLVSAVAYTLLAIQLQTKYTETGIEQPAFFRTKVLRWQDVQEIRNITTGNNVFVGADTKININLSLFGNPTEFVNEVRLRIPPSAYPRDEEIEREINRQKRKDAGLQALFSFLGLVFCVVTAKNIVIGLMVGLFFGLLGFYHFRRWLKLKRSE